MADPRIIEYIRSERAKGIPKSAIYSSLFNSGWPQEHIEIAFSEAGPEENQQNSNQQQNNDQTPKGSDQPKRRHTVMILAIIFVILAAAGAAFFLAGSSGDNIDEEGTAENGMSDSQDESAAGLHETSGGQDDRPEEEPEAEETDGTEEEKAAEEGAAEEGTAEDEGQENEALPEEAMQDGHPEEEALIPAVSDPCQGTECTAVAQGNGAAPAVSWNMRNYGILWSRESGGKSRLYFAKLNEEGEKVSDETIVAEKEGNAEKPSIAWAKGNYGVIWPVDNVLYFMKINANGAAMTSLSEVERSAGLIKSAKMIWNGSEYAVAWHDTNSKVYFTRLGPDGSRLMDKIDMGEASSRHPSVTWADGEYGISWLEMSVPARKIYFARIKPDGERISTISVINDEWFCNGTSLSWKDKSYGIAYSCFKDNKKEDSTHKDVFFMRLHSTGGAAEFIELDKGMVPLTLDHEKTAKQASVAMGPENHGFAWADSRDGNFEIYFNRIKAYTGTAMEDPIRITTSETGSLHPEVIWTGSEFGIAWTEEDGKNKDIYFTTIPAEAP
ncbi:MAG: hypothetical protein R6U32_03565 [Candidatus Woesearchaeota archaeon]